MSRQLKTDDEISNQLKPIILTPPRCVVIRSMPSRSCWRRLRESRSKHGLTRLMEAQTLNCPNCGAAISSDAPQCQYCESKLATVACPSCFGMMFLGSKHCPHCGATAVQATAAQLSILT